MPRLDGHTTPANFSPEVAPSGALEVSILRGMKCPVENGGPMTQEEEHALS